MSAKVECGHKFHESCIKQWILSSANCPTCRFNIKIGSAQKWYINNYLNINYRGSYL